MFGGWWGAPPPGAAAAAAAWSQQQWAGAGYDAGCGYDLGGFDGFEGCGSCQGEAPSNECSAGSGAPGGGTSTGEGSGRASKFDQGPHQQGATAGGSRWDEGAPSAVSVASSSRPSRFDEAPAGNGIAPRARPSRFDEAPSGDGGVGDGGCGQASVWPTVSSWGCTGGKCGFPIMGKGGFKPPLGANGETLYGTVKSYSAVKGFGFLMHDQISGDIWFASEALTPDLRTSDIAGNDMAFILMRTPDGKPQARSVWVPGTEAQQPRIVPAWAQTGEKGFSCCPPFPLGGKPGFSGGKGLFPQKGGFMPGPLIGRPLLLPGKGVVGPGWLAAGGSGGVFVGKGPDGQPIIQQAPKRNLSPHAGSRAIAGAQGLKAKSKSRSASKSSSRASLSSSKSSSSSSRERKKKKKKNKKKHKSKRSSESRAGTISSSSRSRSRSRRKRSDKDKDDEDALKVTEGGSEIEVAKREALAKLTSLQAVEPKEERAKQWRSLLRSWHPDKNPDKSEVATAVFQFLQKGKGLINL